MAVIWPGNDERAVLTLACCGEQLATRVENAQDTSCIVHLPVHACLETNTNAPDNVLSWFSKDHCWTLPVSISGMGGYPRTALWVLQSQGEAERWQRRDYVRIQADLDIRIFNGDVEICALEGLDVSEGGLRVALTEEQLALLPEQFNVSFEVAGGEVRAPARLVWSAQPDSDDIEAIAGFEYQGLPQGMKELIGNYVFKLQIDQRRRRLASA